jgi:Cu(I)/Ag(I) efflux system membrane protein CusA/SilA
MIEKIVDWSAKNKFLVLAFFVLVGAAGIWALHSTPLDAIPDLSENQVIVFSEYMGRSPQTVENQVTFPLVTALQGLAKVKAVRAQSMFGMAFIYIIFDDDVDYYWARSRVLEKLSSIQSSLPAGAKTVLGPDGTGVGHVFWYTVEGGGYDLGTLRAVQDWFVKLQLQSVEGVAEVASIGGYVKQYQVSVDPNKILSFGLTLPAVRDAVIRANNDVGGKIVETNERENFVRGQGYFSSTADIENTVISASGSIPIKIKDIGSVSVVPDIRRGSLEKNGEGQVTGGIVVMRLGENADGVIKRVKEKIEEIRPGLPKGVEIHPSYDRSELIEASIDNLLNTLLEEAIIVTLVVLLFLLHIPSALRIVIEIPISVLIAFIAMRIAGITSNIMSLGGIAIGIGVLIDGSIVMLENAHRHLALAQEEEARTGIPFSYQDVIIRSVKQVARAIFFSLVIIVVSFLPVFLLTGQEGKLFHPLAFTKTFSLAGSAIVSITLIPVLMMLVMRGRFKKEEKHVLSRSLIKIYKPVVNWALRHRKATLALNALALVIAIPIGLGLGSEFMPPLDEGSLLFMPTMLPNVSMPEATRILTVQDAIIKQFPEVDHVLGKVGKAETATDPAPVSMIETIILLKPKDKWRAGMTKEKITEALDSALRMPGVANGWTQPIINRINMLSTGVRTDLGLKIFGPDLDTLEKIAINAESMLREIPGAADVVAERVQGGSFLDITINREKAARYGIAPDDINDIVESAIGGENIGTFIDGRARFPISVRFDESARKSLESIMNIPVPLSRGGNTGGRGMNSMGSKSQAPQAVESPAVQTGGMGGMSSANSTSDQGTTMAGTSRTEIPVRSLFDPPSLGITPYVPLSEIAEVRYTSGPPMIASENGLLRSVVFLNVRGRDMGSYVDEARKVLKEKLRLPAGYTYSWSGQFENQERAKNRLMIVVPLVFLLIFFLLYLTLKDIKEAAVVMLSVPFALIGGVYLVAAMGMNWSVAVWVGFIALYGVAVETGVVMVVYLHEALDKRLYEHNQGKRGPLTESDIFDATLEGSALRLRPKVMTVAAAMAGLLPILWSSGVGSDLMRPIAAPMVGGLLSSAVHVLVMTPVLFYIMKRRELRKGTLKLSSMAGWMKH